MSVPNLQATYKQNTAQTATPGELTLMLYNGCLKFINRAKKALQESNVQEKSLNIMRAQDIIRELMVTLKTDSDVGKDMLRIYDYILNHLIEANVKSEMKHLVEAEQYVVDFRDTWKEVIKLDRIERLGVGKGEVGGRA